MIICTCIYVYIYLTTRVWMMIPLYYRCGRQTSFASVPVLSWSISSLCERQISFQSAPSHSKGCVQSRNTRAPDGKGEPRIILHPSRTGLTPVSVTLLCFLLLTLLSQSFSSSQNIYIMIYKKSCCGIDHVFYCLVIKKKITLDFCLVCYSIIFSSSFLCSPP